MPRTRYFKEQYTYQDFVQMVRDKLDRQRKKQADLAKYIGISPVTMCKLLDRDRLQYMNWQQIYKVFEFLDFSPAERLKVFGINKESA